MKLPKNYVDLNREGYGLWEIWKVGADSTGAVPVCDFTDTPSRFLTITDAKRVALECAQNEPDCRFKVVLAR